MVGMSGASGLRVALVMANPRKRSSRIYGSNWVSVEKNTWTCPAKQRDQCFAAAAIGDMIYVYFRLRLEKLALDMGQRSVAGRGEVERAGPRLRERDQFGDGFGGDRWMDGEDFAAVRNAEIGVNVAALYPAFL